MTNLPINQKAPTQEAYSVYFKMVVLVIAMHLAGFLGLQWQPSRATFELLIPFNLVSTTLILLYFHQSWNTAFAIFALTAFLVGFGIEWLGVHTGLIFGSYQYGHTLGFKLDDIPPLIGLNWLVLVYSVGVMSLKVHTNLWLRAAVGASLMVLLDILIEPVAIKHNMWSWNHAHVPLQNYVAWWIVAYGLVWLFLRLDFKKENVIAVWIYGAQFFFFLFHNLTYFLDFF